MRRPKRNALSAKPEHHYHQLSSSSAVTRFRKATGRMPREEDYQGVHTTGEFVLAASYAVQTAAMAGGYPVVLVLNVKGLTALPDVDALLEASDRFEDSWVRESFQGLSIEEAQDADERQVDAYRDDIHGLVWGSYYELMSVPGAFSEAFEDPEQAEAAWELWLDTGKYPVEAAIALVDQRRYMRDFDTDRLVEIRAVRPWWDDLLDEDEEEQWTMVGAAGYTPISKWTADYGEVDVEIKTIAKGKGKNQHGYLQYHGTSSKLAEKAFGIKLSPDPFPTKPRDEVREELGI